MKYLVILGSCGGSRETWWVAREVHPGLEIVFADDVSETTALEVGGLVVPVIKNWEFEGHFPKGETWHFVPGMGDPRIKKIAAQKALEHGLVPCPPIIGRGAIARPDCRLGVGTIMHPTSLITTNVTVGDFVTLHTSRAGHDTVIEDYVSCLPGTNVGSHALLGEGVCLGAGTVVRQRVQIAPWVYTGMQACVVKDIRESGIVVAGVPAKPISGPSSGPIDNTGDSA